MKESLTVTLEQAKEFAADFRRIPVCKSIYADVRTPVELMRILRGVSRHCYMLESLEDNTRWGRYTFLGYDPTLEITCQNGRVKIRSEEGSSEYETDDPAVYITKIVEENRSPSLPGLPPFTGGLVGYFSYDFIKYSEPTLNIPVEDDGNFRDFDLMLFEKVIAYDNFKQQILLIVNMKTDDPEKNYEDALSELLQMENLITDGRPAKIPALRLKSDFQPLFDKDRYCGMVRRAQKYIYEGDIFQVVLSNRLTAEAEGSLFDTYRVLRTTNPSPYMFYFSSDDIEIAGASPETLVKLQNGELFTYPLAGTRRRGQTDEEDRTLEAELLADPKECSEHTMLVDLGRNDIGKISRFGSVKVLDYMKVVRYSHVMHIASTVRGEIADGKSAVDAMASILPAGTLSGAPKIRACEIIAELENNKRGIYGGAIGYIDLAGNMDTCIAIRIAFKKGGRVFVRSGAGIVADSVPENEHQECLNKAAAVLNAIRTADNGLGREI
ncbi:MAG: anthranilate synthase component I [Eubacteriales bacterium]